MFQIEKEVKKWDWAITQYQALDMILFVQLINLNYTRLIDNGLAANIGVVCLLCEQAYCVNV